MAADIDAVTLVIDRARQAAHLVGGLEHDDIAHPGSRQLVGRRQARGPGADDDDA
ncbi:hypothetical protein D3C83_88560 [compost metagenome]